MPRLNLSDAAVRALVPPAFGHTDVWDAGFREGSFAVRVSAAGTKTFVLKLDNTRKKIGRYPAISLADARTEARRIIAERILGKTRPQAITYGAALDLFLAEKRKSRRPRTVDNLEKRLRRHFPFKGQLSDVKHQDVAKRLNRIDTKQEHDHALSVAKTFFTWAYNRRYIDDNPTRGFELQGSASRTRVLSDDELRAVWIAADQCGQFGTIVKLLILTGQRRGEIAALQASWVTNDTIILPSSATKNGREHCFPLSGLATSTLKSCIPSVSQKQETLLFPARRKRGVSFNGWSKGKAQLDKLSGVKDWTLHDLRRTFATRLADLEVPPHIIERLLNHVSGTISGVAAIYNKARYMPEMRAAVDRWESRLNNMLGHGISKAA